ncbi:hypothetical protein pb186bvf_011551 [Paramecium bursaria]
MKKDSQQQKNTVGLQKNLIQFQNLILQCSMHLNQKQHTEKEASIIAKVKQVLNFEEQQILCSLLRTRAIWQLQVDNHQLKVQDEKSEDLQDLWKRKEEQNRKFLRKVPNFYISMFKKWLTQQSDYYECKFLAQIRNTKKSKQQRFELNDLKECFSKQHMFENKDIDLKPLFIEFLTKWAPKQIMNNKKATDKNKSQYIEHIQQLLIELSEEQPFKNYYRIRPARPLKCKSESKISDDDCSNFLITEKNQRCFQMFSQTTGDQYFVDFYDQ